MPVEARFHDGEIVSAKYGMVDRVSVIILNFGTLFAFACSEYNCLLYSLASDVKFFLAEPDLSSLRMHEFISCEMFLISPRKTDQNRGLTVTYTASHAALKIKLSNLVAIELALTDL